MKLKIFSILMLCLLPWSTHAEIVEIQEMKEILPQIDQDTLVVFDLDNTIMEPKQALGSEQWFSSLIQKNMSSGMSYDEAVSDALPTYLHVHMLSQMQAVEPQTPELIKNLQDRKIRVIGLTARSLPLVKRTHEQLQSIGVDMAKTSPMQASAEFRIDYPAHFKDGVCFSGNNNKGKALAKLLSVMRLSPKKIVFVDDKRSHVEHVSQVFENTSISLIGFRYGGTDEKVRTFDPRIAEIQLRFLEQIISNEAAKAIVSAEENINPVSLADRES